MKRKIVLEENDDGTFRYEYNDIFTEPDTGLKHEVNMCYSRVIIDFIKGKKSFVTPSGFYVREILADTNEGETLYTIKFPGKEGVIYV